MHRPSYVQLTLVELVLTLLIIVFKIKLVKTVSVVHHEGRVMPVDEETVMFEQVRAVLIIILPDLSKRNRKSNDLLIQREVKLFLLLVIILIPEKVHINFLFNSHSLLRKANHISLIYHKISLIHFMTMNLLILNLHDMRVRLLLRSHLGRLMNQPNLMILVDNQ